MSVIFKNNTAITIHAFKRGPLCGIFKKMIHEILEIIFIVLLRKIVTSIRILVKYLLSVWPGEKYERKE
jgi:hypothetical protein